MSATKSYFAEVNRVRHELLNNGIAYSRDAVGDTIRYYAPNGSPLRDTCCNVLSNGEICYYLDPIECAKWH